MHWYKRTDENRRKDRMARERERPENQAEDLGIGIET